MLPWFPEVDFQTITEKTEDCFCFNILEGKKITLKCPEKETWFNEQDRQDRSAKKKTTPDDRSIAKAAK